MAAPSSLLDALRPLLQSRESRLEVKDFCLSEESLHLRLFSVYGPGEAANRLVASLVRAVVARRPIDLTGGRQVRDFVFIDDVVEATSTIGAVGHSSFVVEHRFEHAGEHIAQGSLKHVWIRQGTPASAAPLPDWLRAAGIPSEAGPS